MCNCRLEHRVEWSGNNIKVLNRVLIQPPYTADSIEPIGDINDTAVASAKEHVRKIVSGLIDFCKCVNGKAKNRNKFKSLC